MLGWGRKLWLIAKEFFVTVGPWVFTLIGGIFLSAAVSDHPIGQLLSAGAFWIGAGLILLGIGPLTVSASIERLRREEGDARDAREVAANRLAASYLSKLPVSGDYSRGERIHAYESARAELVEAVASEVFGEFEPRVIYFEYGVDADGVEQLVPVAHAGCEDDPPRIHVSGEEKFMRMLVLVKSPVETEAENQIPGRKYRSFVSASVSGAGGTLAYGLLSVDTTKPVVFDDRDGSNLLLIARLLAAFRDAADRA